MPSLAPAVSPHTASAPSRCPSRASSATSTSSTRPCHRTYIEYQKARYRFAQPLAMQENLARPFTHPPSAQPFSAILHLPGTITRPTGTSPTIREDVGILTRYPIGPEPG